MTWECARLIGFHLNQEPQSLKLMCLLTVYIRIKLQLDLQANKSHVVVKGPFFPQLWTQCIESVEQMCDARINLIKPRTLIFKGETYASNLKNIMKTNLIDENWR
jgi:hypothetical protein